jgi:5-bromo-4-chloroindolyl phosphate hydrolysis protein
MFNEVKIFDKKGKFKKVISSKNLSTEYWNSFFNNSLNEAMQKGKRLRKQLKNKKDCDDENLL